MGDLQGLHIVVTRPRAQAESWAESLRNLGARVSLLPLMEIVPLQQPEAIGAIKNRILNFDCYQKAIFVSQNAVEYGFAWIEDYWPQLPQGVSFFAVGESTSKLLQSYGARVTDLARTQTGAMTSEALLQSPHLQNLAGEKIVIFRGQGGRTHLGEVLLERGAKVDYCELYERSLPADAAQQCAQLFQPAGDNSCRDLSGVILTLHSGEAFANLISTLQQIGSAELLLQLQCGLGLLVPSQRVAEQAASAGFHRVYTADNATDASMLQRLTSIHSI